MGRLVEVVAALMLICGGSLWMLVAFGVAAASLADGLVAAGLLLWSASLGVAFVGIGLAGLASLRRR